MLLAVEGLQHFLTAVNHPDTKSCTAGVAERLYGKILSLCVHQLDCMIEGMMCSKHVLSYFHNKMSRCL